MNTQTKTYRYYPLSVYNNQNDETELPELSVSVGPYSIPVTGIEFSESVDMLDKLVGTLLARADMLNIYDEAGELVDELITNHYIHNPDPISSTLYDNSKQFMGVGNSSNYYWAPPVSVLVGNDENPLVNFDQETLMRYDVHSIIFYKDLSNATNDGIYLIIADSQDEDGNVTVKAITKFGTLTVNTNDGEGV